MRRTIDEKVCYLNTNNSVNEIIFRIRFYDLLLSFVCLDACLKHRDILFCYRHELRLRYYLIGFANLVIIKTQNLNEPVKKNDDFMSPHKVGIVSAQVLLVLIAWGAAGVLLYTNNKLLVLLLLISCIGFLTVLLYSRVSRKSQITAVVIIIIMEVFLLYNDFAQVKESGKPISQFQIMEYLLHFSAIIPIGILLLINKNKMTKAVEK